MITLPPFKKGDTWSLTCTYKRDNKPFNLDGIDIHSQIRTSTLKLIAELHVEILPQIGKDVGVFILTPVDKDTSTWVIGKHQCDMNFSKDGVKLSTETFGVNVVQEVTFNEGA